MGKKYVFADLQIILGSANRKEIGSENLQKACKSKKKIFRSENLQFAFFGTFGIFFKNLRMN